MMVYCDYDIRNENGDVIITSSDHISLEVFHLDGQEDIEIDSQPGAVNKLLRKKITLVLKAMFSFQLGTEVNITIEFHASPKPLNSDIVWVMNTHQGPIEVND